MKMVELIKVPCAQGVRVDLLRSGKLLHSGWAMSLTGAVRALRRVRRHTRRI